MKSSSTGPSLGAAESDRPRSPAAATFVAASLSALMLIGPRFRANRSASTRIVPETTPRNSHSREEPAGLSPTWRTLLEQFPEFRR